MNNSAQHNKQTRHTKWLKLTSMLISCALLTVISNSIYANDYLDALANEAESTASVSTSNQLDKTEQKEIRKMEGILETERPSTYKFYTKLYPKNKELVYKYFANDQSDQADRLTHLQKKVMDLYFNQ